MFSRSRPFSPRLLLGSGLFLLLASVAPAADAGFLLLSKNSNGFGSEVRKVRKLERNGGFYVAQLFSGASERFDAFHVGPVIDLSTFETPNLAQPSDLASAKALDLKMRTTAKQYPELVPHLAPYLSTLRGEIERAERGETKMDGKWLTAAQVAAMKVQEQSTIKRGALQLKNGTAYRDVEIVSATSDELRILHSDGAARVPMHLVPDDFKKRYLPAPDPSAPKSAPEPAAAKPAPEPAAAQPNTRPAARPPAPALPK